ncbi:hypothetical protein PIB30_071299, partial [Stylosanthes scabra]|nr:hypothetical protein [Stylosanthes scabra]
TSEALRRQQIFLFLHNLEVATADSNLSFALAFSFIASDFSISTAAFRTYNAFKSPIGCA